MSQSADFLQRKIKMAEELKSVVKNLKTMAATRIRPCEDAVLALTDYYRTVELGLVACMREFAPPSPVQVTKRATEGSVGIVVFGSDQGMVGRFNDHLAEAVLKAMEETPGRKTIWPIGDRIYARLLESALSPEPPDHVPDTIQGVTPLISRILQQIGRESERMDSALLVYNRPLPNSGYEPVCLRLLPLDAQWLRELKAKPWPTKLPPQVRREKQATFEALIREYLFVSTFRACAESMTSENATRLASMQGAEDNINHLLEGLHTEYNQTRQSAIDAELFEVVSGFETIQGRK